MNLNEAKPVIRHGGEISFEDFTKIDDYKIGKIKECLDKGYKTVAVICKTDKEAEKTYNSLSKYGSVRQLKGLMAYFIIYLIIFSGFHFFFTHF